MTTAKKTAAKKAAPKPAEQAEEREETPVYDFPLPKGSYYYTPVTSRRAVASGDGVRVIRKALGLSDSNDYTDDVRKAVADWQREHDLAPSGVVDEKTWSTLVTDSHAE